MIQPIDIKTVKFKKGLFGYKTTEVDTYVDTVYRAYEDVVSENAELSDKFEKLNESLQESRLKLFELENKAQQSENGSDEEIEQAKNKAEQLIKDAELAAANIVANAKNEAKSMASKSTVKETSNDDSPFDKEFEAFGSKKEDKVHTIKVEPVPDSPKTEKETIKESASSKFFKMAEDSKPNTSMDEDDDEIFVGEIEEPVKRDRMMIGDGEEEDTDFEFL